MRWRRTEQRRARAPRMLLAAVAAVVLAACGVAHDPLALALGDASSAGSSVALALQERADGKLTGPAASTMIQDARRELADASRRLEDLSATGARIEVQADALVVLATTARDLHDAERAVGTPTAGGVADRLRRDADLLGDLKSRAEGAR